MNYEKLNKILQEKNINLYSFKDNDGGYIFDNNGDDMLRVMLYTIYGYRYSDKIKQDPNSSIHQKVSNEVRDIFNEIFDEILSENKSNIFDEDYNIVSENYDGDDYKRHYRYIVYHFPKHNLFIEQTIDYVWGEEFIRDYETKLIQYKQVKPTGKSIAIYK